MDNARLPNRVMVGEVEEGKGSYAVRGRARTGRDGMSQARHIVVQLAHRSETLDISEALVRYGEGASGKTTSARGTNSAAT